MSRFGGGFGGGGTLTYAPYIELPSTGYLKIGDDLELFRSNTNNLGFKVSDVERANIYRTGTTMALNLGDTSAQIARSGNPFIHSTAGSTELINGTSGGPCYASDTPGALGDAGFVADYFEAGTPVSSLESGDVGAGDGTGELFYDASAHTLDVTNGTNSVQASGAGFLSVTFADGTAFYTGTRVTLFDRPSDPSDPDNGSWTIWMSDGTATGNAGDLYMKINVGGTTKTVKLYDYTTNTIQ